MQYERNDQITYDEDFIQSGQSEIYNGDEFSDTDSFYPDKRTYDAEKDKSSKAKQPFPSVILFQLIVCILCGLMLYGAKMYFPDTYADIRDKLNTLINDSLVVDGNNLNDYFVNNG